MKKEDLLLAMNEIDESYITEAASENISGKRKGRTFKKRFGIAAACFCAVAAALGFILFLPNRTKLPDVSRYADSEYYAIIQKINELYATPPEYKNNFDRLMSMLSPTDEKSAEDMTGDALEGVDAAPSYQETTDNQVEGVIEGDLLKRTDQYLFYLDNGVLKVFSIAGLDSTQVGEYSLTAQEDTLFLYADSAEFFLSQDGKTITVLLPGNASGPNGCILLLSLDVSDPGNIREANRVILTGGYQSARVTNGKLLLISEFRINGTDFSREANFVPQIDTGNGFESIPAKNIVSPECVTSTRYTVVSKFDEATLTLEDTLAFLSYSEELYVSEENVFVTRRFIEEADKEDLSAVQTEVSGLRYAGEKLSLLGSVVVPGYVKDQYSLDEYEGILRLVTTTDFTAATSASLYCIDLANWKVAASVENFAPKGETVRSVRFDKTAAYVCTAIEISDPVFFFDLSDLNNITYKDTGTIAGFSTSLVNFGNGFLLGIGVGAEWASLKVEVYEEATADVVSVCAYELPSVNFSEFYKSYLIDRENQLIGLGYTDQSEMIDRYLLLSFDGYRLHVLADFPLFGDCQTKRAAYIDGSLYAFGTDDFAVVPILENQP